MYDLSAVFGLDELSALSPGASLLVADTDGTDTRAWLTDALGDGLAAGEGGVLVSTDEPVGVTLDGLDGSDRDPGGLCVIDCQGSERASRVRADGVFVYSVPGPDDITGIGVGLSACLDRLTTAGYDRARVGVDLTALLGATDDQATFKFVHVVASRLGAAGFLALFGLGQPHSPESRRILTEAVERTIELKTTPDGVAGRLKGRQLDARGWQLLAGSKR